MFTHENIKIRMYKLIFIASLILATTLGINSARAQSDSSHEYEIKAAFMYQFFNFIEGWDFEQNIEDNVPGKQSVLIGVIGEDPFNEILDRLTEEKVKDKNIAVKHFEGFSSLNKNGNEITTHPDIENIKQSDLLFLSSSEEQYIENILDPIRDERIITLADMEGFLEKGGIINFIIEDSKVCFEINIAAMKRANLTVRSQMLRLAKRVLENDKL